MKKAVLEQWWSPLSRPIYTYNFHPRPALMNPSCISTLISSVLPPPSTSPKTPPPQTRSKILDPFCGTGTTLLTSILKGHDAYGVDCSPHAVGISMVQTMVTTERERQEIEVYISGHCDDHISSDDVGPDSKTYPTPTFPSKSPHPPHPHDSKLELVFRYVLDYECRVPFETWRRPLSFPSRLRKTGVRLVNRLNELAEKCGRDEETEKKTEPNVEVHLGDARYLDCVFLNGGEEVFFDGLVTSPPYPGVYDYRVDDDEGGGGKSVLGEYVEVIMGRGGGEEGGKDSCHEGEGDGREEMGGEIGSKGGEIGSKKASLEASLEDFTEQWIRDTSMWLEAAFRRLRLGGRAALLVGDNMGIDSFDVIVRAAEIVNGREEAKKGGWRIAVMANAKVVEGDGRRPWGKHKRNFRTEHCTLLEKRVLGGGEG
ncbi:hypothetical protein TrCOL_g5498 [Triparma columacea]|uniref:site-specific DNA-methyltransferase (cytosine-N(4)-specific) n=1 Tax=Triparma columacea TaxID=722753 RepID=A0A9W7GHT6_9STRA|nr:hypothetical protein TrCOL_g5498 [Triparma columacea]